MTESTFPFASLRDAATTAIRLMVPGATNVVIALTNELPAEFRGQNLGYVASNLDLAIRPYLGFGGRAVAMVVNTVAIVENQRAHAVARRMEQPTPRMLTGLFLDTVAHELGHLAYGGFTTPADEDLGPSVTDVARKLALAQAGSRVASDVPWNVHHGRWVRLYLHAAHRLARAMNFPQSADLDAEHGLSSARAYESALGDEPAGLEHIALTQIGDIAAPIAFAELWQRDVVRWWRGLEHPTSQNTKDLLAWRAIFT